MKDFSSFILMKGLRGETKSMNIDSSAITTAAAKMVKMTNITFSNFSLNLQCQNQMSLLSHSCLYFVIKGD